MSDKYNKAPNPKEALSRFKQKLTHQPTEQQIERWEYEGGATPNRAEDFFTRTLSFREKLKYFAEKIWKLFHKEPLVR
jgi:hypothetical protein